MPRALLCVAALAAAADGLSWLLDGFRSDAPSHDAATQAIALRSALRDAGYKLVAKYRYKMFGQVESCREPTPKFQSRFLDYEPADGDPPTWSH